MPTSAPSSPSSGTTLLLQRRLSGGDSHKWRTVLRFTAAQANAVTSMVAAAQQIDSAVTWRVCRAVGPFPGRTRTSTDGPTAV